LHEVYDWGYDPSESLDAIKEIYNKKLYNQPWSRFSKQKVVQLLMDNMRCEKLAESYMRKFHKFIRSTWPKGGYEDSDSDKDKDSEQKEIKHQERDDAFTEDSTVEQTASDDEVSDECEEWFVPHFFSLNDLHNAGNLTSLPHHISTANEIKTLANQVEELLSQLSCPVHVTLATSRLDRYLPDSQAAIVHGICETLLQGLYDTENIIRLDRPKFSVDNVSKEDQALIKARDILDICDEDVNVE